MQYRALRYGLAAVFIAALAGCASRHEDKADTADVADAGHTGGSAYPDERIVQEIRRLESDPSAQSILPLRRVRYLGQRAYLLTSPCCDLFNHLYSADGRLLCAPSGGLTGRGDGSCRGKVE
ncbi:hypothetical protein [Pseudacidovorax sp. RU35E]|uniref:DUF6970 domain-containing protein n=1 Tax=Pseudacidovorax sp. RU35E TaxID=1907403 RepID=UPI0009551908|nr:hypothetical protein [Pseudacidovorax sp. RU35E]SIR13567.1 hypothetical protein SAMN05880557_10823 [Pseudacidovorax sp. RU35E]